MSTSGDQEWLGVSRAAEILGISRQTMRKLGESSLPPDEVRSSGRSYWRLQTLMQFKQQPRSALPSAARIVAPNLPSLCTAHLEPPRWCKAADFSIPTPPGPSSLRAALDVVSNALVDVILLPDKPESCPYRAALIRASLDVGTPVVILSNHPHYQG